MLKKTFLNLINSLFQSDNTGTKKFFISLFYVLLFSFGIILWIQFFNFGNIPNDKLDWLQVTYPRFGTIQDALKNNLLPLHISDPIGIKNITDRFLTIPDLILTPDLLLLRVLEINDVILIHVLFCYGLGYYGLIRLKRRLNLSFTSFFTFFMLFNFNGFIISHFSVGHLSWGAYFFFPFFLELIWEIINKNLNKNAWIANYSLLQFLVFLFGGYHFFVWISAFMIILFMILKDHRKMIFMGLIFSCLVNAYRILPASLLSNQFELAFHTSFSSTGQLIQSLISSVSPEDVVISATILKVNVWELDFYIGFLATVCIVYLSYLFFTNKDNKKYLHLLIPIIILSFLSIGNFYKPLFNSSLPIVSGERVFSRFFIIPMIFFFFVATIEYQRIITEKINNSILLMLFWIINLLIANDLTQHVSLWGINQIIKIIPSESIFLDYTIKNHNDSLYFLFIIIGLILTFISLALIINLYKRSSNNYFPET